MTYLIYRDGSEINRIVADKDFCERYCKENGYTYELEVPPEPPEPEEPPPTEADDAAAMLVDHEYRLTLLELGLTEGGDT